MTAINPGRAALRAHIALIRAGAVPVVIATLLLLGAAAWIGFAMNAWERQQEQAAARIPQAPREPPVATGHEENLQKFYAALGDQSEAEQGVKVLFAIAAQMDISLDQGEYQWQFDRNSGTYRYQVLLPVKGLYGAIRRFCEEALLALPFASLDELSFKRETIGEDVLDASLRFTFYLKNVPHAPQEMGRVK